jgi:hypothetical protein
MFVLDLEDVDFTLQIWIWVVDVTGSGFMEQGGRRTYGRGGKVSRFLALWLFSGRVGPPFLTIGWCQPVFTRDSTWWSTFLLFQEVSTVQKRKVWVTWL